MRQTFLKNLIAGVTVITGVVTINMTVWLCFEITNWPVMDEILTVKAAGRSDIGVVTYVSSKPKSSDKETIVDKTAEAGFSWAKEEYTYSDDMNWAPYDGAYSRLRGAGLRILGLLTYSEGMSHEAWKNYIEDVVDHYPGVSAWEIMNEADNYLSAADYVPYLQEAYDIIKSKSSATVISSGATGRKEIYGFWDGLAAAGGWGSFDALGLHLYHDGNPYEDSYNNGILSQEVQQVVDNINKNGGGKGIWVTEYGYDSDKYGLDNQANWLVEGLGIISGFGEVERIFIYRLFDRDNATGLLNSSFGEKPAYGAVKSWLSGGEPVPAPAPAETSVPPAEESEEAEATTTPATPKTPADQTKSSVRLDGENVAADGKAQYRIVVRAKDAEGNILINQKPSIFLTGGQTAVTDFVLVGEEWFAYVAAAEAGERTAQIKVGGVELGTIKMIFGAQTTQSGITGTPAAATAQSKINPYIIWFIVGAVGLNILVVVFLMLLRKRYKFSLKAV